MPPDRILVNQSLFQEVQEDHQPMSLRRPLASLTRPMSTSTSSQTLHRFFVYAPDKTDPGTLERRMSVREKHLVAAKVNHESGVIRVGGMVTTPDTILNPDAPKKIVGSTLIFEAESIDQVKNMIENDIYYTSGVWDAEKIIILPFFSAFPLP